MPGAGAAAADGTKALHCYTAFALTSADEVGNVTYTYKPAELEFQSLP